MKSTRSRRGKETRGSGSSLIEGGRSVVATFPIVESVEVVKAMHGCRMTGVEVMVVEIAELRQVESKEGC